MAQSAATDLEKYSEDGERALSEHRYAEAEAAYEKLRQLAPNTAEVCGRLGLIYFQEGKFEQAVPVLRKALQLKPSLPNTDVLLAMSLSELGDYNEAVADLQKGFRRVTDQPLKRLSGLQLLRAYTGLQHDREAVQLALDLNRLFPNDPEVLYHTSRVYANFAYLTLHKLAEVAPESIWRRQAAAEADESLGNFNLAVNEYRQLLQMDPNRRGIHYRIGRALLSGEHASGDASQTEALLEFEEELKLDPTNANAAYEIGDMFRRKGQLDKAQEFFGKALDSYPDFEEAQVGMGGVQLALGKPEVAMQHLKKAIALNSTDDVAYYRLSQAYKAMGDTSNQQNALAEFRRLRDRTHAELARPSNVTKQEVETAPQ